MEFIGTFLIIFVIYGIFSILTQHTVNSPGRELHKNFISLGNLQGKSYEEISKIVGEANSSSNISGFILKQWITTGGHMAIQFDSNLKFVTITHQFWNY